MRKQLLNLKFLLMLCMIFCIGGGSLAFAAEKITDYTKIVSGKKYFIRATTSNADYYLKVDGSTVGTGKAGTAVTQETEATVFVFEGSGTSWTIKFDGTSNYLSLATSKANGKVDVVTSATAFTLSNTSKGLIRITKGSFSRSKK